MERRPGDRIFGVETEFGCLVEPGAGSSEAAVELVKDYVFRELRLGLLDRHSRDEVFEPAESGGFLTNGARLYIDAVGSHLEYATAECRTLTDLVANDRAGQRHIVRAVHELGLQDDIRFYNNSVDHFGGHTFGCHENYLVQMDEDFFTHRAPMLYPFLITRQIYAGVGRVGGHVLYSGGRPNSREVSENPIDYIWVSHVYNVAPDPDVKFQLSQRADHILKTVASRVRFNRALINPKWDHFYSHDSRHRLHLLFGESNQSEYAYALKVGTTSVVLRLLEENRVPDHLQLASPLHALRDVSRDPSYEWLVEMADGAIWGAVDLQREYWRLAQAYRGESPQTDWVLNEWSATLDGLETDPMALDDRLDWVAKRKLVEMYMESEGLDWSADALHSIDLEFHNIDPAQSLAHAYAEQVGQKRLLDELDIVDAMTEPPSDTRARGRSLRIKRMLERKERYYVVDWNGIAMGRNLYVDMPDPFDTYADTK